MQFVVRFQFKNRKQDAHAFPTMASATAFANTVAGNCIAVSITNERGKTVKTIKAPNMNPDLVSKSQERYTVRRQKRDDRYFKLMRGGMGTRMVRQQGVLNPYEGEHNTFKGNSCFQKAKRISFAVAEQHLKSGAEFKRGDYGANLIVQYGTVWGSITDTDARKLNLI